MDSKQKLMQRKQNEVKDFTDVTIRSVASRSKFYRVSRMEKLRTERDGRQRRHRRPPLSRACLDGVTKARGWSLKAHTHSRGNRNRFSAPLELQWISHLRENQNPNLLREEEREERGLRGRHKTRVKLDALDFSEKSFK